MSLRRNDELRHTGGLVLAPVGYYQSLRLIPAIFGGAIEAVTDLDGDAVSTWLASTRRRTGRIVYIPLVNNADGSVLSRVRACSIARAVLDHNRRQPDNPVWVVADDVYAGSHLCAEVTPQPIAALRAADLGDDHLDVMSDHTVTITTPSKTVALPTSRVAFATTTRAAMRTALAHYRTVFSFGRVPQTGELSGVAALCLTPQTWIDGWNAEYRRRLTVLNAALDTVNQELGCEVYHAPRPEGGWYFALRVARHLFPTDVVSAVHASAVLLHYGQGCRDSGVAMLPGELFHHRLGLRAQQRPLGIGHIRGITRHAVLTRASGHAATGLRGLDKVNRHPRASGRSSRWYSSPTSSPFSCPRATRHRDQTAPHRHLGRTPPTSFTNRL